MRYNFAVSVRDAWLSQTPMRSRSRSLHRAVVLLAVTALLLGAVELVLVLDGPLEPAWISLLVPITAGAYTVAGAVAWLRRSSSDLGSLLMAGGLAWLGTGLLNTALPPLTAAGWIMQTLPAAVLLHLLLSFPSGRLTGRTARGLAVGGYVTCLVLQAPLYLFAPESPPYDVLQVANRPDLAQAGAWVQRAVGLSVTAATALLLLARLRAAPAAQRRVLVPLYAYGIAAILFVPLTATLLAPLLGWDPVTRYVVQLSIAALVPVAFGWCLLRGGFPRTTDLDDLGVRLSDDGGPGALRRALADTVADPSLDLLLWDVEHQTYRDENGDATAQPVEGLSRAVADVRLGGTRVGVITYDRAVVDDPEQVGRAGRLVAIAVDRERLTVELRRNEQALQQSRLRIVESGDRERRRLERNLHDGAQQRLVAVCLQLRLAETRLVGGQPVSGLLNAAAGDLDDALKELRELARGLHPALLADVGLSGAVESLAERSPIPVQLSCDVDRALPESCEVGAYYLLAEALTNAARHSGATRIDVRLHSDERFLVVEVVDDGVGGAIPVRGSGLEGLADRVESLGGRLSLLSPVGSGTSLVAELPCA